MSQVPLKAQENLEHRQQASSQMQPRLNSLTRAPPSPPGKGQKRGFDR